MDEVKSILPQLSTPPARLWLCAWCRHWFDHEGRRWHERHFPTGDKTSHGVCDLCAKKMMESLDQKSKL